MIEWPFFIPFAALSENFAYSTFCFLWVWFQFWFWPKFKRERSISKLRFKTFFIERKNFLPFSFFIDLYYMYLYTQPQIVSEMRKSYLNIESYSTPLGNIIIFIGLISFRQKKIGRSFKKIFHISDSILEQCVMCVYALN